VANGYPLGVIAGKKEYMDYFVHPDKDSRVLIAGTYNAFPLTIAAGIATLEKLASKEFKVYDHVYALGEQMEAGLKAIFNESGISFHVSRQGSAFCVYFMDHQPVDFHDLLLHHNFALDKKYRRKLIENGIFHFPLPIKQGSISYAHSAGDISKTLEITKKIVKSL
jgi:glutamate-1-semialdehyde 2,1-aminomutase